MATSGSWSATRKVPDIEHIHKWEIEDFDLYMMRENGMIKSNNFSIPGVPGEFYMAVAVKTEWIEGRRSFIEHMPTRLFGGAAKPDLEIQIEFYFSVILKYKCKGMVRAAGKLEITKEGAGTQLGEFGDSHTHSFDVDHDTLNKMLQFIYTGQETTFECQTSGKSCVFEYFPSNRLKMKTSLQSFSTPLTNMSLAPL